MDTAIILPFCAFVAYYMVTFTFFCNRLNLQACLYLQMSYYSCHKIAPNAAGRKTKNKNEGEEQCIKRGEIIVIKKNILVGSTKKGV